MHRPISFSAVRMARHHTTRCKGLTDRCGLVAFVMTCHLLLVFSLENRPGYIGCFVDKSDRALEVGATDSTTNEQSVEWCFRYCLEESEAYKYAGLEHSDECFCGNNENYYRHGRKSDKECQDKCAGNDQQVCGDSWRISIYQISNGVCSNDTGPPSYGNHTITNPPSLSYNLKDFKFLGTRVRFGCDSGYTLQGASSIECVDTGNNTVTWNDTLPSCQQRVSTAASVTTSPFTSEEGTEASHIQTVWSTISMPPPSTTLTTGKVTPTTRFVEDTEPSSLQTGTVVGIVCGLVVPLVIVMTVLILWMKRRKKTKDQPSRGGSKSITMTTKGAAYTNNDYDAHECVTSPDDVTDAPANQRRADGSGSLPERDSNAYEVVVSPGQLCQQRCEPPTLTDETEWVDNIIYE